MPRIKNKLYQRKYNKTDLCKRIKGKMRENDVTQADMAVILGLKSQSAVSAKLSTGNFDYEELMVIFDRLHFTNDEILKFMKIA